MKKHFAEMRSRVANANENRQLNQNLKICVKCSASSPGSGSAVNKLTVDGWKK